MKKNEKNEGLQSRREFFKKAAKGALPILGLAIMANVPMISNAAESEFCACSSDCKGACSAVVLQRAITNAMLVVKLAVNTVVDQHVMHLATDDKMFVVL